MERLTKIDRNDNGTAIYKEPLINKKTNGINDYCSRIITKLAYYEDLEEQGLLFKILCHCKDCVHVNYEGCAGTTCYCMKNGCFMQNDDFCVYAEKKERMKARNNQ